VNDRLFTAAEAFGSRLLCFQNRYMLKLQRDIQVSRVVISTAHTLNNAPSAWTALHAAAFCLQPNTTCVRVLVHTILYPDQAFLSPSLPSSQEQPRSSREQHNKPPNFRYLPVTVSPIQKMRLPLSWRTPLPRYGSTGIRSPLSSYIQYSQYPRNST
jgi:hypothetical protein